MQKQELTFILQAYNPLSKVWSNVFYAGCGIRQKEYSKAFNTVNKVFEVMKKYSGTYRIIKKYRKFMPYSKAEQLKLEININ